MVHYSRLCSFQPNGGSAATRVLAVLDQPVGFCFLPQAGLELIIPVLPGSECLSGLLLWAGFLEGWGLSPAVLSTQEHGSFQSGFASIRCTLIRGLFSPGRREATEGFQVLEKSWTSLSKEHQEHGGKFSMCFSKILSSNTGLEKETATH